LLAGLMDYRNIRVRVPDQTLIYYGFLCNYKVKLRMMGKRNTQEIAILKSLELFGHIHSINA
jgi:hypothetical protein